MVNVLIVDDEVELCRFLKDFLELHGFRVWMAVNGQEALAFLEAHQPGVLLLDLSLGRGSLSGIEVLRQGRGLSPTTRVIVISGTADTVTRAEVLALGAARYLEKPHSAQDVLKTIREIAGEGPCAA